MNKLDSVNKKEIVGYCALVRSLYLNYIVLQVLGLFQSASSACNK